MANGPHQILTATNAPLSVTNLVSEGSTAVSVISEIPLTTVGGEATGQICVPVVIAGGGSGGAGSPFDSSYALATSSGSIPAGVLGWSITAITGTVTVQGASLPVGVSARGGGYTGYLSNSAIAYTVTGGSAAVSYDAPS